MSSFFPYYWNRVIMDSWNRNSMSNLRCRRLDQQQQSPTNCDSYSVHLDVTHFLPSEINVKLVGDSLLIHAKHSNVMDGHGTVSREFTRRYQLPPKVDLDTMKATWNRGVLSIEASFEHPADCKIIPVRIQMGGIRGFERILGRSSGAKLHSEPSQRIDSTNQSNRSQQTIETAVSNRSQQTAEAAVASRSQQTIAPDLSSQSQQTVRIELLNQCQQTGTVDQNCQIPRIN